MTAREKELLVEERKWEREKTYWERKLALIEKKRAFRKAHLPKVSTSKMLIMFLFLNCTIIELFTGWVTIKSFDLSTMTLINPDFTPLVTLIGAIVSEVIGYAVYSLKSMKENTAGGIVYEQAMSQQNINNSTNSDGSVG